MTCTNSNTISVAKGASLKKTIFVFDIITVGNERLQGSSYSAGDYTYLNNRVFLSKIPHTSSANSKPRIGSIWTTYRTELDTSQYELQSTYFTVRSQRNLVNDTFYFIISDGTTDLLTKTITPGGDPDDVITQGKINFWITEAESGALDVGTYSWELSYIDASQEAGRRKGVQCTKGIFTVCINYND